MTICLRDLLTDKYSPSKITATMIAEKNRVRMLGKECARRIRIEK
jgi:hypothetical protein